MILGITLCIGGLFISWMLYALPATFSLPSGIRPGIEKMTIDDAVEKLNTSSAGSFELIEKCRQLIITRMQYCRRNSFDSYKTAFKRGYGYCQQQAYALKYILTRLGFTARVVHAYRNRFPDGSVGGHAWVRISYNGIIKDVDPTHVDLTSDRISFVSLTKVREYTTLFRLFAGWGSIAVNAYRYYKTGTD